MLRPVHKLLSHKHSQNVSTCKTAISYYSKRSGSENSNTYKVIKTGKSVDEIEEGLMAASPNWELLSPRGYRFYLPGSVGPAWHDQSSSTNLDELESLPSSDDSLLSEDHNTLECVAQECPLLLRRGVLEMFPNMRDASGTQLTIVTLTQKSDINLLRDVTEVKREKLAKNFVVAAQEICTKLKLAGYWADFINPFSGLPYLSPTLNTNLFQTDERFRCLGFEVTYKNDCTIIGGQQKVAKNFVGSLFTTAPANMRLLKDILYQYE